MRFYFRKAATWNMEGMIELHNFIMYIDVVVFLIVVWMVWVVLTAYPSSNRVGRKNLPWLIRPYVGFAVVIEILWTVGPTVLLIAIAVPSFGLLYRIEKPQDSDVILKVMGNQWYWNYQYGPIYMDGHWIRLKFDSFMLQEDQLKEGQLRLLEVDKVVVLPIRTAIKFLVTADDVIHSFSVTELGIKMDAIPGRLNRVWCVIERPGVFRGQCSELCGVNHAYMPIVVYGVHLWTFLQWVWDCSGIVKTKVGPKQA
jgi:heme/copper-type cytochrome/quinol oxidase subunit 2